MVMLNLIDFILDLFRSPAAAARFIADPDDALRDAGLPSVTAAQLQAVAASAAPAGVLLGGGDPVVGLQRAVADHHSIASPFSPQTSLGWQPTFAPETEVASRNNIQPEFLSPDQSAGANAQSGAFNLGFGDITLGDKTSNTATDGGVVVGGDNDGDIDSTNVEGDGNVVGEDNNANTGIINDSNANIGEDNELEDNSQDAGGDLIADNDSPVFNDVDTGGGHGGGASGGGSLIGIGGGNDGGDGGGGGSIIITDTDSNRVGGDQLDVGGGYGSDNSWDNSRDMSSQVVTETQEKTVIEDNSSAYESNLGSNNDIPVASNNDTALGSDNDTGFLSGNGFDPSTDIALNNDIPVELNNDTTTSTSGVGLDAF